MMCEEIIGGRSTKETGERITLMLLYAYPTPLIYMDDRACQVEDCLLRKAVDVDQEPPCSRKPLLVILCITHDHRQLPSIHPST